jgi:peptidylprolyl isomerase
MTRLISTALLMLATTFSLSAQRPAPTPVPPPADVAKPPADAVKTASGLSSKVLTSGKGTAKPGPADIVTVHYTGWTTDGKMFDSSVGQPSPATFPLNRLIKGWGEGLQLMVAGEKRRFWIPQDLAYGGQPSRPAGMLVFDVELISFSESPSTPPADVAAVPADAKKTASGLAYRSLRPGKGGATPVKTSNVTVHYTGWTTDGKMFDSSVANGRPLTFGLDQVIAGWTEGLQLMTVGEKMRFWIPENIAYQGKSAPYGMLVFDVELIAFK